MKSEAHQRFKGAPEQGTCLQKLEGLPLRLIALKLSNPGPLAASCKAAHRSFKSSISSSRGGIHDNDFEVEWFMRWVHVLAPFRPCQYAAVTWQRLGGPSATAEQLTAFILRISGLQHKQQQQQRTILAQSAAGSSKPASSNQQQQLSPAEIAAAPEQQPPQGLPPNFQQADGQAAGADTAPKPALPKQRFGPMPHNVPLPSIMRHARKLLAKGKPLCALAALCPGQPLLLYQYAAAAGNLPLLQELVQQQHEVAAEYPVQAMFVSAGGCRVMNVAQLSAYAALKAGHGSVLAWILTSAGASIKSRPYQVGQLFRYAVRHSNSACIQQLMDFAPCPDNGAAKWMPWPQHLAMAAGRADPWAAEVISLLLRVMNPKLLAAKHMGPVYSAACRTGHMPVLTQLLQLVLASSAKHLPVLLTAAAAAGNRAVWEQLLGGQQQQQRQGGKLLPLPLDLLRSNMQPSDCWSLLLKLLDSMCPTRLAIGQEGVRLAAEADRAAVVESFWELLSTPGMQVAAAVEAAGRAYLSADLSPWGSYGRVQELLATAPPGKLVWLLQHGLLPDLPSDWVPSPAASKSLLNSIGFCLRFGQRLTASKLWRLAQRLRVEVAAGPIVQCCLNGAVKEAAAAQDWERLQQQVLFTEYWNELVACACISVEIVDEKVTPTDTLLLALSCVWNAAVGVAIRGHGLLQQMTVRLAHHLQVCAAVVLPAVLRHMPQITPADVQQLLSVIMSVISAKQQAVLPNTHQADHQAGSAPAQRSQDVLGNEQVNCNGANALFDAVLRLRHVLRSRGIEFDAALVLHCTAQLAGMWGVWLSKGRRQLALVPLKGSLACLLWADAPEWPLTAQDLQEALTKLTPLPLDVPVMKRAAAQFAAADMQQPVPNAASACAAYEADSTISFQHAAALPPAEAATAASVDDDGLPGSSAGALHEVQLAAGSCDQPADADAAGPGPSPFGAASAANSAAAAPKFAASVGFSMGASRTDASLSVADLGVSGRATLATALLFARGSSDLRAAERLNGHSHVLTPAASAMGTGGIMPLWQHAALALPVSAFQQQRRQWLKGATDAAVEAILQPVVEGSATPVCLGGSSGVGSNCSSSTLAAAAGHDASALAGAQATGVVTAAGAVIQTAAAAVRGMTAGSMSPAAPPERDMLSSIMAGRVSGSYRGHWNGPLHRPDALAWALHPAQQQLWERPNERHSLIYLLNVYTYGVILRYRFYEPLLLRMHEQQLQQHVQEVLSGVTEGFGALPRFVAGAADAASTLLANSTAVNVSGLAKTVGGGSSAAHVAHVKGFLGGVLAASTAQFKSVEEGGDWLNVKVGAVRKAQEVGDIDLLTQLVMLNGRAIKPVEFWLDDD